MKTSHKPLTVVVSALAALGVIIPQPARGFSFEDFRSPAPSLITINGDAAFTESVLRLTPDEGSKVGSAFFNAPFEFDSQTSFSSHFQFRIHGERAGTTEGADGLVFIIQNDPRGVNALGTDGSGLGYSFGGSFGESPINNSIGVAFDTFPFQLSNESNVELLQTVQDATTSLAESLQSFNFASGNPLHAWIDYSGETDLLEIFLSPTPSKPSSPVLTQTVAIDAVVGSHAFFGFSAATGARFNIHDIESWELSVNQTSLTPLAAQVALSVGPEANDDTFTISQATFILGDGSDGIAPPTDAVTLRLGTSSLTIPAGSFHPTAGGAFEFAGEIDEVMLQVTLTPLSRATFTLIASGEGANLAGIAVPMPVGLTIGDDGGSTTLPVAELSAHSLPPQRE